MFKNFIILLSLVFLVLTKEKIDFSKDGQEYNAISYYFTDLFDNLQIDRESTVYLVYEDKKLSENDTNLQYLFYFDLGEGKKFYVGIESESNEKKDDLQISDYVSSTNLSKVLNFLNIEVEDVFQNNVNINYAKNLLTSELKPKFCNLESYETLTQSPLIKKQQFYFDFNTLGISKNPNYQTDEKKPHQVFINLPDNLTAHSIEIVRTNIDKKNSSLEQTNKNILSNSQKKDIINMVQTENPENNINLDNFDEELDSILNGLDKYDKNRISISSKENGDDVLVKKGNLYNNETNDEKITENTDFPRFQLESINYIQHPNSNIEINEKQHFPSQQDFNTFKKSIEKYGKRLSELNKDDEIDEDQEGIENQEVGDEETGDDQEGIENQEVKEDEETGDDQEDFQSQEVGDEETGEDQEIGEDQENIENQEVIENQEDEENEENLEKEININE